MHRSLDAAKAAEVVTGRTESLFAQAMREHHEALSQMFGGKRVLITGGGGFIAGQTIRTLLPLQPARLVVADTNENSLAELIRDLRTSALIGPDTQFEPRLVDIASPLLLRLLEDDGPFDCVMAFAAAKHVRSERDPVSALHMLNVNINGTVRTVDSVVSQNPEAGIFVVSTDKAADPASLMGASKRLMELAVFARHPNARTTRFANVAFSAGSLLESWLVRLGRDQILPVPSDTERYFVTPAESGQLCTLAASAPAGSIVIPDPAAIEPTSLMTALQDLLAAHGLEGVPYVGTAPHAARPMDGTYPILVTPRDTPGEKQTEVFAGRDEDIEPWLENLSRVTSPNLGATAARQLGEWVAQTVAEPLPGPSLAEIAARIGDVLPNMRHIAGAGGLDQRI